MIIRKGLIKRIHVNMPNIRANHKDGGNRKVFSVQLSTGVQHTNEVHIDGPSKLVWHEDKPLSCGARAWIETKSEIKFNES